MSIPEKMTAVRLLGHGGYDMLRISDRVAVPSPGPGDVLIEVHAAGINNTDINTRIGWYSDKTSAGTSEAQNDDLAGEDGDWTGQGLTFPRIQGADVCGVIVGLGVGVDRRRLGQRVIVQGCLLSKRQGHFCPWLGSEYDGSFAQFTCAPAADTYAVECDLSDAQLAAVPCAYGTAENLLGRARLGAGETVLITGASGNVGLAAVQLARLRGAHVIAVAASEKAAALETAGARRCVPRGTPLAAALGKNSVDVVIDVVGGPQWPELLDVIRLGGRYAVSGAIAGPIVEMDLRKLYLKDLSLFGCTLQDADVFPRLVGYLEEGVLQPLVAADYPLKDIVAAQQAFLSKTHVGKIILIPPQRGSA